MRCSPREWQKVFACYYGFLWVFWKMIWYLPTEYFFSKIRLILYQPSITHEPTMIRNIPTMNPRIAGLKRIAIPKIRQRVQKRIMTSKSKSKREDFYLSLACCIEVYSISRSNKKNPTHTSGIVKKIHLCAFCFVLF